MSSSSSSGLAPGRYSGGSGASTLTGQSQPLPSSSSSSLAVHLAICSGKLPGITPMSFNAVWERYRPLIWSVT